MLSDTRGSAERSVTVTSSGVSVRKHRADVQSDSAALAGDEVRWGGSVAGGYAGEPTAGQAVIWILTHNQEIQKAASGG